MLEFLNRDRNWLLDKIDQLNVWSRILNEPAQPEKQILNPLRNDKSLGSCKLEIDKRSGKIIISDFADRDTNGMDCIAAYMKLNPHKSWTEVMGDLLNMGGSPSRISLKRYSYKTNPNPILYEPIPKKWTKSDLKWWEKRGVQPEQLNRESTLTQSIKGYKRFQGSFKSQKHFSERAFSYSMNNKHKFYFPDRNNYRFLGNMKQDDLWFLNRGSKTLLVSKAHKDMLVSENLCDFNLTHVQNERVLPTDNVIFEWETLHDRIIFFMDNDSTGIEMANKLKDKIIYTPVLLVFIEHEFIKDIDEYYVENGFKETYDYFSYLTSKQ